MVSIRVSLYDAVQGIGCMSTVLVKYWHVQTLMNLIKQILDSLVPLDQ